MSPDPGARHLRPEQGGSARGLGWPCPTADGMRAIDRDAIEKRGLPSRLLMESAGRAIAHCILGRFAAVRRPLVVCGSGNNGGDGFVVARVLRETGAECTPRVVTFGPAERRSPETAANFELWMQLGCPTHENPSLAELRGWLGDADLIVDALFGVGLTRPIEGALAEMLAELNAAVAPRVAVDVPSGLSSDTGGTLGVALHPDLTVTVGLPKLGLALRPLAGELCVVDIGFPAASLASLPVRQWWVTDAAVAARLPERASESHKGRHGHVLCVAGGEGKVGAAALAVRGALRAGAGLVTAAVPRCVYPMLAAHVLEAMTYPLGAAEDPYLSASALEVLLEQASARDVVAVGPGLGTAEPTARVVRGLLAGIERPAVVDADGLNVFAGDAGALRSDAPRVLTPHPAEAARLLDSSVAEVQADRAGAARALAAASQAHVLLKGARSVIAAPSGELAVNPTGGPGLASGGTGDVLCGVVAALLAQGLDAFDAAVVGAYLHGRAGEQRPVGLLAHEVADAVPGVWQALLEVDWQARASSSDSLGDAGRCVRLR